MGGRPADPPGGGRRVRALGLPLWALAVAGLGGWVLATAGGRQLALLGVGLLFGAVLLASGFGFTGSLRRCVHGGSPDALRPVLALIALTTLLFAPLLAAGSAFGPPVGPAAAPLALQVAAGAALFGVGMQLAGGCGSGTLHLLGAGHLRMLVVVLAFCAGSFVASLHMGWWARLPGGPALVLGERIGWGAALLLQLALLALLWRLAVRGAARRAGPVLPMSRRAWLAVGALALLNLATLVLAGHPWSITWAYALWGAKAALQLGWDPAGAPFWQAPFQAQALASGVVHDVTSVMNVGLVLGATGAVLLAGRAKLVLDRHPGRILAAVFGGLLMGYGARIGFGCTVGALLAGTASTSVHGWLWFAAVLPGVWLGARLRPRFGLGG